MTQAVVQSLKHRLEKYGQDHVIRFLGDCSADERPLFLQQLAALNFDELARAWQQSRTASDEAQDSPATIAQRAQPPGTLVRLPQTDADLQTWKSAREEGKKILDRGEVGVILVAGGQGTRLQFHKPKGMYPIGPVSNATLFQILAEQVLARSRSHGVTIPYYIMTSDATHAETVAFFEENNNFGLPSDAVRFFQQGTMPALDAATGKLLLADKNQLATSPDGHGGMIRALKETGMLADMQRRGLKYIYYHQVDNPMAIVCDPAFLGFHQQRGSELSTKVVAKRSPTEKVGLLVEVDGKTQIIEYSDLPAEQARLTDATGGLKFWAGNTAIHLFNVDFLARLTETPDVLPFHLAHKPVPYIDDGGVHVEPAQPNAIKLERFIFDALPLAKTALVLEADRSREFNPVKNQTGDDSPDTSRAAMTALYSSWLKNAGVSMATGVAVEISPLWAHDEIHAARRAAELREINEPTYLSESES
ncbi:MAG: UDPGP type 1 family protein [Planctomycetota bacterium]|nr:UDPGP type 1 family protein [Planctomycetota bacterium]